MPLTKKQLLATGSILGMALALGTPAAASVQSESDELSSVPKSAQDRLLFLGYPDSGTSSEYQIAEMMVMEAMEMMVMEEMEMMVMEV